MPVPFLLFPVQKYTSVCSCASLLNLHACARQHNNHGPYFQVRQDDIVELQVDLESQEGEIWFIVNGHRLPNWYVKVRFVCVLGGGVA